MGYAALMHMEQGVALGRVLPMVMLGSLTAIVISGCLNQLGKRFPHLTGEGQLMPNRSHETRSLSESEGVSGKTDVGTLASGALLAVLLYMMGMLGHKLIGLPAPVGMLFLAVLLKLANVVSPRLQEGRRWCINSSAPRSPTDPLCRRRGDHPVAGTGKRLHFNQPAGDRQYRLRAGGDRFPGW